MNEIKPEIKYTLPEININFNENINPNNDITSMNKLINQFENIENIRTKSLIITEISYSKIRQPSKVMNSSLLIHNGVSCNKCQIMPIRGYRFKCPRCLNYNLCQECEQDNSDKGFHPHSNFILCRVPETSIATNDYSYQCLTSNLETHQKHGTQSFNIQINLKNDGNYRWPSEGSILKCIKEKSTIFCDKVNLPGIDMNEETNVTLNFNKCNKIPKGKYICYINCIINEKIRGKTIEIIVFIE